MARQSISLTPPNDDWLKAQVASQEFTSKSEVVNDLIRKAREIEFVRAKLIKAERSGFTDQTSVEILTTIKEEATLSQPRRVGPQTRVLADTNVFYYLSDGRITKSDIIRRGETLSATPINVLELIAGIDGETWETRQCACQAILDNADTFESDPDTHLTRLFKASPKNPDPEPWQAICQAVADATELTSLTQGIPDQVNRVLVRVKLPVAAAAKQSHYAKFASDMARACEEFVPGYSECFVRKQQVPKIPKARRVDVRRELSSDGFHGRMFDLGLKARARLLIGTDFKPSDEETQHARAALQTYLAIYGAYIDDLVTSGFKPDPNDWGDLDSFLYLQSGVVFATNDIAWIRRAKRVKLESHIREIAF